MCLNTIIYCNEKFRESIESYNNKLLLDYRIDSIKNAPFKEINELLHESFKERLVENLNFDCATFSVDNYKELSKDGNIVTIWDEESIIGTVYLGIHMRFGFIKCGFHEYLAVKSRKKKTGIGTKLQIIIMDLSKACNLDLLLSSTAIPAISSVNWHVKNGFLPYKISSYKGRNYNSYNFLKPINNGIINTIVTFIAPMTLLVSKFINKFKL